MVLYGYLPLSFLYYTFSSTLAGYLVSRRAGPDGVPYSYNFALLTSAAAIAYGYSTVVPVVVWGAMKWYGCEPSILECLCLYGYGGMIVWIPVSMVVSVVQILSVPAVVSIVEWVSVGVGFGLSSLFLIRNFIPVLNRADNRTSRLLMIGIVALQGQISRVSYVRLIQ